MESCLQLEVLRVEGDNEKEKENGEYEEEDEYEDVEEDENNPRSINQQSRAVEFWKHIFKAGWSPMMNEVTRAIPRDPYAGLLHVHHRIWHVSKVAFLIWKACLMCINVMYIIISFLYVWTHEHNFLHGGDNSIVLSKEGAVACVRTPDGKQCIHTNLHRFYSHQIITAIEFLGILVVGLAFILLHVLFICGGSYFRHLPSKHPWFFFFAPSSILSWSTLQAFQLVHPARIYSIWCLNEKLFWRLLFCFSLVAPEDEESMNASSREPSLINVDRTVPHCCFKWLMNSVGIFLHVSVLLLSFQASLLKLSSIHFAAVINSPEWTFWEWILVLGFFNQLVTAINPNTIEFHRVLFFLFGGADGHWTKSRCIVAHEFLSLAAYKICHGKIGQECRLGQLLPPIFGPLAAMWSFTAHDLQNLVCCPLREKRLEDGTPLRGEVLEEMWRPSHCDQFIQRLKEADRNDAQNINEGGCKSLTQSVLKAEKMRLSEIRNSLCRRVHRADPDSKAPHSVRLLIAAEIQNGMEDLDEIWKPTDLEGRRAEVVC